MHNKYTRDTAASVAGPKCTPAPDACGPPAPPHGRHSCPQPRACADRANRSPPSRPGPVRLVLHRGAGRGAEGPSLQRLAWRWSLAVPSAARLRRWRPRAGCPVPARRRRAAQLGRLQPQQPRLLAAGTAARCPGPGGWVGGVGGNAAPMAGVPLICHSLAGSSWPFAVPIQGPSSVNGCSGRNFALSIGFIRRPEVVFKARNI